MPRRFCDDCRYFPAPMPPLPPSQDPKRRKDESQWSYDRRVRAFREANSFELEREPICVAGYRMSFQAPKGHPQTDHSWGHYRQNCARFEDRHG